MTIYAFEHGKDVYCEKPLACTYADAQKMLEAQKKAGKKLTSGTQWRYNTAPMEMKRMYEAGEFGDVYYIRSSQLRRTAAFLHCAGAWEAHPFSACGRDHDNAGSCDTE